MPHASQACALPAPQARRRPSAQASAILRKKLAKPMTCACHPNDLRAPSQWLVHAIPAACARVRAGTRTGTDSTARGGRLKKPAKRLRSPSRLAPAWQGSARRTTRGSPMRLTPLICVILGAPLRVRGQGESGALLLALLEEHTRVLRYGVNGDGHVCEHSLEVVIATGV